MSTRSLLSALSGALEGWSVAFFGDETERILVAASPQRRQVWCAIWSQFSLRADRIAGPEKLDQWRDDFRKLSSRALLARAGFGHATGFLSALRKLGWMALEKADAYLILADTLESGGPRGKLLRHLKTIDLRAVELVSSMPYIGCSSKTLERMRTNKHLTPQTLNRCAWRLERLQDLDPETAAVWERQFASDELLTNGELNSGLPFPVAPWTGTVALRPLDNPSKMENAALRFSNCLANQMRYVWEGSAYFYELDGVAILEFGRVADLGWEMVQLLGPKNETISSEVVIRIGRELKHAPRLISPIIPSFGIM